MSEQEPKYWLHRISWEWQVSYPLYNAGYLSIGWGDFGTDELLSKLQNNFDGTIDDEWGQLNRNRFSLQNFISKMKKGDYVVVPRNGTFDIVRIKGDKVLTAETLCREKSDLLKSLNIEKEDALNKLKVDLGFFWEIELVCDNIPRKKYNNIAKKLHYRGTNLDISDIRGAISQLIKKTDISMRNMRLVRTFHPVGHGAFYAERFYEGRECVFSAVYDCGASNTFDIEGYIDECINNGEILNRNMKIDAIFISHFHSDHVSGLSKLLPYCKKIFLPHLTKNEIARTVLQNSLIDGIVENPLNKLFFSLYGLYENARIYTDNVVFIDKSSGNDEKEPKYDYDPDPDDPQDRDNLEALMNYKTVNGNTIPSGSPIYISTDGIMHHIKWIYLPFNYNTDIPSSVLIDKLTEIFPNLIVNGKVIIDELQSVLNSTNGLKRIKSAYARAIDKDMNHHSMTVYSGYYKPWDYCFRRWVCDHCCCGCEHECCCMQANCLYTGDFEFSKEHVSKLISFYKDYWECSRIIQVPHHGSESIGHENYDYSVYLFCKHAVISTTCMHKNVTSLNVILKLKEDNIDTRIVTENPISKYEQKYRIY